jgi:hypothetical protein
MRILSMSIKERGICLMARELLLCKTSFSVHALSFLPLPLYLNTL